MSIVGKCIFKRLLCEPFGTGCHVMQCGAVRNQMLNEPGQTFCFQLFSEKHMLLGRKCTQDWGCGNTIVRKIP